MLNLNSNIKGEVTSTTDPEVVGQPIPEETAKTIADILEKEVSEGGGTKAMVEGYHFGGKTGTAQKLDTKNGGYLAGRYIASFIGFGPVEDPKFVFLLPSMILKKVLSMVVKLRPQYLRISCLN